MSFPVPAGSSDLQVPLMNLSTVSKRLDSLHQLLSESVKTNTVISQIQMDMVSSEISSAIQNTIINGAALLACSSQSTPDLPPPKISTELKPIEKYREKEPSPSPPPPPPQSSLSQMKNESDCDLDGGDDVIELDAVELLAEHVHFCSVCGKGFKRDANLRMHMRAHGNQFKTAEALAKPKDDDNLEEKKKKKARFSCPYEGCNRNREHSKFKALKSVICVRNHFKRSHCPKTYTCSRCNKKNFSVEADLRSHFKHCGELRWKCTCGTSFSRKDKLFGHMALFEGHMPAAREEEGGGEEMKMMVQQEEEDGNGDEGLLFDDGFGSMEDVLEYPASTDWQREMSLFCGFGQ